MKRYLLFAFENYEQRGGWEDFQESFDDLDTVKEHMETLHELTDQRIDSGQVVDMQTSKVCLKFQCRWQAISQKNIIKWEAIA